mmetsp:Transcript_152660/g.266561  ORF Transcript_152660/g.266561 Transcript_152660/m.266561 type:complete len:108 (-) Transcript_152660:207-530(-)
MRATFPMEPLMATVSQVQLLQHTATQNNSLHCTQIHVQREREGGRKAGSKGHRERERHVLPIITTSKTPPHPPKVTSPLPSSPPLCPMVVQLPHPMICYCTAIAPDV